MSEITVPHIESRYPFEAYAHVVEPLTEEDGGGLLITFPDLPGCMSDGETEAEPLSMRAIHFLPGCRRAPTWVSQSRNPPAMASLPSLCA